jgi:hypothetical protein
MMMDAFTKKKTRLAQATAIFIPLAVLTFAPGSACADFQFTASASSGDGPVSAEAYFTLQNGQITLYLANLISGVQGQGEAISGIQFTVSGPPDTSLSLQSVAANVVTLRNGTFTPANSPYQTITASGGVAANWAAQINNNMTDLGNPSHPYYMIVGPNASFSGNGGTNFNPYFESTATSVTDLATAPRGSSVVFVLNAPGVTSGSTVSNVLFNFGTSPNEHTATGQGGFVSGPDSHMPAPSSAVLLGIGSLSLVGFAALRRHRPKTAVA